MSAGKYRQTVSIYRPLNANETTQNAYGEDLADSVLVGDFYCKISPLQGSELNKDSQVWGQGLFGLEMRHQPGIAFSAKMRAYWNDGTSIHYLNILSVSDVIEDSRPLVTMVLREYAG